MKSIVWLAAMLIAGCAIQGSPSTAVYLDDKGKFRYVPAEDVNAFWRSNASQWRDR